MGGWLSIYVALLAMLFLPYEAGLYAFSLIPLGMMFCPVSAPAGECGTGADAQCNAGTRPASVTVDVASIAGTAGCGAPIDCTDLNGSYVCTHDSNTPGNDGCIYRYTLPTPFCEGTLSQCDTLSAELSEAYSPNETKWTAEVCGMTFRSASLGTPPQDCSTFGATSCPLVFNGSACDTSSATVDVTV